MSDHQASSLHRLEEVARTVSPLANRLVFTGSATVPLLVEQSAGRTEDAEAPITAISYSSRDRLRPELRNLGLEPATNRRSTESWRTAGGQAFEITAHEDDEAKYSNPWYAYSLDCTTTAQLMPLLSIRIAGAPAFLAAAWWDVGHSDGTNEDLTDVLTLVHGRTVIVDEIAAAPLEVRTFLAGVVGQFLQHPEADLKILDALPRAARLPGAVDRVFERLERITRLGRDL